MIKEVIDTRVYADRTHASRKKESDLALKYFRDCKLQGTGTIHWLSEAPAFLKRPDPFALFLHRNTFLTNFANSLHEPMLPSIIVDTKDQSGNSEDGWKDNFTSLYRSFSGVKSFLRNYILNVEEGIGYWNAFWHVKDNNTFYYARDENGEEFHQVSCFGKNMEKRFSGDIRKAPHQLISRLEEHDFDSWHNVNSWELGSLEALCKKADARGIIIDKPTCTVLFADDVNLLKHGKSVPFIDLRHFMEVDYAAYFCDKGKVYGLYAQMLD